jgi:hypothetical protein
MWLSVWVPRTRKWTIAKIVGQGAVQRNLGRMFARWRTRGWTIWSMTQGTIAFPCIPVESRWSTACTHPILCSFAPLIHIGIVIAATIFPLPPLPPSETLSLLFPHGRSSSFAERPVLWFPGCMYFFSFPASLTASCSFLVHTTTQERSRMDRYMILSWLVLLRAFQGRASI